MKARGKREPITVVGHAAVISAGEFIQASGEWANDRTHGVQLRARFLKTMPPTTTEGIEKYLGSGMIRGIGPAYARKLLRAFGSQVFDVIDAEPHRLREVVGISPKRADGIARFGATCQLLSGWLGPCACLPLERTLHMSGSIDDLQVRDAPEGQQCRLRPIAIVVPDLEQGNVVIDLGILEKPFAGCATAALLKNLQMPDMIARRNP